MPEGRTSNAKAPLRTSSCCCCRWQECLPDLCSCVCWQPGGRLAIPEHPRGADASESPLLLLLLLLWGVACCKLVGYLLGVACCMQAVHLLGGACCKLVGLRWGVACCMWVVLQ